MKLLVIDGHPLARDGLRLALHAVDHRIELLEATDLEEAFGVLDRQRDVRLIILDPDLAQSRGLESLRLLKGWIDTRGLDIRIVVFSGTTDTSLLADVLEQHGTGMIPKSGTRSNLREAFELTLAGGVYTPETLPQQRIPVPNSEFAAYTSAGAEMIERLTTRELEVLRLLIHGFTYRRMARLLVPKGAKPVSPRTVQKHVGNIAMKFGVSESVKSGVLAMVARHGMLLGSAPLPPSGPPLRARRAPRRKPRDGGPSQAT